MRICTVYEKGVQPKNREHVILADKGELELIMAMAEEYCTKYKTAKKAKAMLKNFEESLLIY